MWLSSRTFEVNFLLQNRPTSDCNICTAAASETPLSVSPSPSDQNPRRPSRRCPLRPNLCPPKSSSFPTLVAQAFSQNSYRLVLYLPTLETRAFSQKECSQLVLYSSSL